MENIVFAIFPVWERRMVGAGLLDGLGRLDDLLLLLIFGKTLLALEAVLVRCLEVHSMRVNDLGLLLQVEGRLMVFHLSVR